MKGSTRILVFLCVVCLCPAALTHFIVYGQSATGTSYGPIKFVPILVNGEKLTGPNSTARRRKLRTLIPVRVVARALGDAVTVDAVARVINVRRQTGETSDFDARIGGVRQNGMAVLIVSNPAEIIFSPSAEELYLPTEIVAALFDVAIRYDTDGNTVFITRGQISVNPVQSRSAQRAAEIDKVDYEYGLNRYSSVSSQNLNLSGTGRLGDGRFHFSSSSSTQARQRLLFRNAVFELERPNGQRLLAGDFGTASGIQFLDAYLRGVSTAIPFGNTVITTFAGRSFSGTVPPVSNTPIEPQPVIRNGVRYDTNIFGAYVSTNSPARVRKPRPLTFAAGALRFNGSGRSGALASGSLNYADSRFNIRADFGYGRFHRLDLDKSRVSGAAALDLTGTFQITDRLAIQGRYAYIGANLLSPQSGQREPVALKAAGVTWSPRKWLSTSFNASMSRRPGDRTQDSKFATALIGITPGLSLPRIFLSHTQSRARIAGSSAFTILSAAKEFARLRLFLNATRIRVHGTTSLNTTLSAAYSLNDSNSVEFSQGIGSHRSFNGQFDWRASNLLSNRLSLSAGAGYSYARNSKFVVYERLSASLRLPRQTSLQVNYYQTNAGPALLLSLKGSLFRRSDSSAFLDSPISQINSFGKVSGRVYQDVNLNGRYDDGIDQPQSSVKVRVDGNRYVVSDESGMFRFDSVAAGDHKVYLDLLSVRADLTLLSRGEHEAMLRAGSESTVDFRLVRTGRISGRVWLDLNENGKLDDGEKPLADVRVVTGSGRDTLTDADGHFVIGDLAPGEHVILIDEKTIPEKTRAGIEPQSMQVFPGRETGEVNLTVIMIPPEVKRFGTNSRE